MKKRIAGICSFLLLLAILLIPAAVEAAVKTITVNSGIDQNCIYVGNGGDVIYYVSSGEYYQLSKQFSIYRVAVSTGKTERIKVLNLNSFRDPFYYSKDKLYYYSKVDGSYQIRILNLKTGEDSLVFKLGTGENSPECIGVDDKGYVYITFCQWEAGFDKKYSIRIYDPAGKLIASGESDSMIYEFCGFDAANGNFYYRGKANWYYYGYDHDMSALKVGRREGSSVILPKEALTLLFQDYFYEHSGCVEMLEGGYLADLSTFGNDTLYMLTSAKIDPANLKEIETSFFMNGGGFSVSGVNLTNADEVTKFTCRTAESEYVDNLDVSSVGTRAVYVPSSKEFFVKTSAKEITAYSSNTKKLGTLAAAHPIYKLMLVGGKVVALEKEGSNYYLEDFNIKHPSKLTIQGPASLKVGDNADYSVTMDGELHMDCTMSSSKESVLTTDQDGSASAWSAGSVTLTAKSADGLLSATKTVTVTEGSSTPGSLKKGDGEATDNKERNDYYGASKVIRSYLVQTSSTSLMRVEVKSDEMSDYYIIVEYMNLSGKVTSRKKIPVELTDFGGFYAGKDAYYIVFGRYNLEEEDSFEVARIVKYDKTWKRKGACSVRGANTSIPFCGGSLRMTETGGVLYIHTNHQMYLYDGDGKHHQSNMTFEVDEKNMTLKDSYTGVMNLSEGYVSHSFNQFIQTDGKKVYRIDHGDHYPRGIAFSSYPVSGKMSKPDRYGCLYEFEKCSGGKYDNETGASIGGFEIAAPYGVVAFNENYSMDSDNRQILTLSVHLEIGRLTNHVITTYKESDGINCSTPQMVKIDKGHLLLLWMETNTKTGARACAMAQINNRGERVSAIVRKNIELSDCQPILLSDKTVCWYVTNGNNLRLYKVNPFRLDLTQENPVSITVESKLALSAGSHKTLTPVIKSMHAVTDFTFKSSNPAVAAVNKKGEVTGIKPGTAKITVTTDNDLTAICKVTVTAKDKQIIEVPEPTDPGKAPKLTDTETKVVKQKGDEAPKGSKFALLQLRVKKTTKSSVTLKWTKVKGAKGYVIYGSKCGSKFKKIKTIKKGSTLTWTQKKLKKGTYYKYLIVSVSKYNKKSVVTAMSKSVHIATKGGKVGNETKVRLLNIKNDELTLKKGKTFTLKTSLIPESKSLKVKHHRAAAFESGSSKIASVSKKGKITAKAKGTCYIYAYAQSGVFAKVKVTVK